MSENFEWVVAPEDAGLRLVDFIAPHLGEEMSRRAIRRAIDANACALNGEIERHGTTRVKSGDRVSFRMSVQKRRPELTLLCADEGFVVFDKPAGLTVEEATEQAQELYSDAEAVHRLDRQTSGVWLCALHKKARLNLEQQFRARQVEKRYLAIVDGEVDKEGGSVKNHLAKLREGVWGESKDGRRAVTNWSRRSVGKLASLVECRPKTGRTHQLRIHMNGLGHPILGDATYCRRFVCPLRPARQLLHAWHLGFEHPDGGRQVHVEAPLPQDFEQALQDLDLTLE